MFTNTEVVGIKPDTRNHRGFFIQDGSYKLMGIDDSGWALICVDDATCHYVDPDNLQQFIDEQVGN
ncbi:MAG: hypothetical protein EA367_10250 [Leptolyngbya sp. DLM2.Bin15]|jgi:hypothetical protein|uniref:hypothetical protein n=1 Tax=Leptolyngbya sp. CCY15150 TaxID=2767772 RepID=UPI001384C3AA|nr:hypothetical protein [Leptolyngbya sp. CCY15150]MBF2089847.1 hypothetical protein [Synechococcales cyanobacterium K32_A2020_035]TVQ19879.1 MAG: hypothetical protein EA367_10250 [Leptolyngbya sp. DLM2.Bin15]